MKKAKKLKAKKQRKKNERVRGYLADINHHVGQLTMALRAVADKLDNVRSYHLDKEKPS